MRRGKGMASKSKLAKTDRRNHPGRGGAFLKQKGEGRVKRLSFYTPSLRRELNAAAGAD